MLHLEREGVEGEVLDAQPAPQQCSHLQEGAVPEAAPDVQHGCSVKAVEWTAEQHTIGRAPVAVLGTNTDRAMSC